ncbi:MAG: histidine phosphatase family protein [Pseudomonadota bacterium]
MIKQHLRNGLERRRLFVIRHGHVDYYGHGIANPTAAALTPRGREQALQTGRALAAIPLDVIFHSNVTRTAQTVDLLLSQLSDKAPPVRAIEQFRELAGGPLSEEAERHETVGALSEAFYESGGEHGSARVMNGPESFAEGQRRAESALRLLLDSHHWQQAVLVAHDVINRLLLGGVMGVGPAAAGKLEQDPCAINVIDFVGQRAPADGRFCVMRRYVKMMNFTCYDTIKQATPRTSLEHLFDLDLATYWSAS